MHEWPVAMSVMQVLGWSLVHFLWQAVLIGALYALVRQHLARGEARYLLGMLALVVLAVCPLLTAWQLLIRLPAIMSVVPVVQTSSGIGSLAAGLPSQHSQTWQLSINALLPWLVLAWSCGVVILTLRVWRHWRRLKALVRTAQALPIWQERMRELAQRFGLRRGARVLSSACVATPALVGWMRPVILLPMAVSCGFPVAQIELILAHELAHLRRFDHLANLFQVILETLLFYHPVVHWISRDVRNERELCCDALALRVTGGSRREFASALVDLEEFRDRHAGLTLAANGGVLLERVGQIAGTPAATGPSVRFTGVAAGLLIALLMVMLLWRQAEQQHQLAESAANLRGALISQLLPASIRMPAQAIANLVPQRLVIAPLSIQLPASAESRDLPVAQQYLRKRAIAFSAPRIADLAPRRLALIHSIAPVPAAPAQGMPNVPKAIRIEQPVYPHSALEQGIEGKVVVEFGLNSDGSVRAPVVVDAQPTSVFDHAAMHALLGSIFAVPADASESKRYRQTFNFTLHAGSGIVGREIQAKAGCYAVTGTNICRSRTLEQAAFESGSLH
ncbi:MAG TPA: TonB family protein [Rhodanobacteraceae bacterium]|nr:TonB family protein [Rhodanobacteraceae bacterium]